jgi:drug/metabolite transporter (DMT)-like permease
MEYALLAAFIVICTAQSLFCRLYSNHYPGESAASSPVFSIVSGFVVATVSMAMCGFDFSPKPMTLLIGLLNGITLITYNVMMVKASQKGPFSVQMVCALAGGILVPAFINLARGSEKLSVLQWVAVAIVIVSIVLISNKKGDQKITDFSFFLYCAGLFLFNGLYGAFLNIQQDVTGVEDKEEMIVLTFGISFLLSVIQSLIQRRKKFLSDFRQTKKSALFLLICAFATATSINLLVALIDLMPDTTVLYTFDNAGVLLVSVISACIFFKEKLSLMNAIGCATLCAGLIMISTF